MNSLKSLSNQELVNKLKNLVSQEQNLTLQILPHLVEVERREIYLENAYSTMTHYCVNELGYGESRATEKGAGTARVPEPGEMPRHSCLRPARYK